jgi:hypothetical protein
VAKEQGVSSDALVNLWLEQKIKEQDPDERPEESWLQNLPSVGIQNALTNSFVQASFEKGTTGI